MGRVINTDSTSKRRNQLMRTGAEILRRLSQKQALDEDAQDMVAMLVYIFREIDEGIESSAAAWEKRDYWVKSEELRRRWSWPGHAADQLRGIVQKGDWFMVPSMIIRLLPHFNDIKITKLTRDESEWAGAYSRLIAENPPGNELPDPPAKVFIPPKTPTRRG